MIEDRKSTPRGPREEGALSQQCGGQRWAGGGFLFSPHHSSTSGTTEKALFYIKNVAATWT